MQRSAPADRSAPTVRLRCAPDGQCLDGWLITLPLDAYLSVPNAAKCHPSDRTAMITACSKLQRLFTSLGEVGAGSRVECDCLSR